MIPQSPVSSTTQQPEFDEMTEAVEQAIDELHDKATEDDDVADMLDTEAETDDLDDLMDLADYDMDMDLDDGASDFDY